MTKEGAAIIPNDLSKDAFPGGQPTCGLVMIQYKKSVEITHHPSKKK
jgi:hypothetical protein